MITKEQIDNYLATQFYTPETAHQARIDIQWAIEQLQAENERLKWQLDVRKENVSAAELLEAYKAENERLRKQAAIHEANAVQYSAEAADANSRLHATKRENERLREALTEMITSFGGREHFKFDHDAMLKARNALK